MSADTSADEILLNWGPAIAWSAFVPGGATPWDEVKVAHLYRRAALGATRAEIEAGARSSPGELIRVLIEGQPNSEFDADIARLQEGVLSTGQPAQLKALWLYRMLHSPHPLRERMTLFWHDHFATSNAKVNNVKLMQQQNDTLRRHALGRFDAMLQELTLDPAMLIWLDSNTNRKGRPNENYAREVFELFGLGVGAYTEKDIQEAARALTGWEVRDGKAFFDPALFDDAPKTVLGQTGRWGAGDVVRICLAQDACPRFIVRKLFRELVSEAAHPSDEMLQPLTDGFRIRNYDIAWLVQTMLSSWAFFSPAAIGQRIKSPVEFAVGAVRSLGGDISTVRLAEECDKIGQSLFYPPSVKGWDGGETWINSTTLLHRQNLAFELTRGTGLGLRCDPAKTIEPYLAPGASDADIARFFLQLFHQRADEPVVNHITGYLAAERDKQKGRLMSERTRFTLAARTAAHLALTLPESQLG